jgi:hypothetical protein
MERRRAPDASMAPVLARLVRSLATLCLAGGVAIVVQTCVWATLCFTEVRSHGFAAVTHPEKVVEAEQAVVAAGSIVSVRTDAADAPTASAAPGDPGEASETASDGGPTPEASTADSILALSTGISTVIGVASLGLLPIVLTVAFVTALVRAPRAANATMAGILWAVLLFGLVLPWNAFWPQVPWGGLFVSYAALVTETQALRATSSPFSFAALIVHVAIPALAVGGLVLLAWRCGEALHAELLAAESLAVDPEIDRDATAVAKKGPTLAVSRSAAGFAMATHSPLASIGPSSDAAEETEAEPRPRRLI